MTTTINRDIIESFLNCKYKAHLKLCEQQGTQSDYGFLVAASRDDVRQLAIDKILASHPADEVERDVTLTLPNLKRGAAYFINATLEGDHLTLTFDALKQVPGPSKLGQFHYVPVLFHEGEQVRKEQRLLLEVYALLLSRLQGRMPASGVVWHGKECKATKVRLDTDSRKAGRLLQDLQYLRDGGPPRLLLNDHCQVCEFRKRCHEQAVREDNLSLLRGIGEKEAKGLARKGILTLTQLAHMFRPRRRGKRVVRKTHHRYHALQALAIRDKRIYVFGTPELPASAVKVYLDIEGVPDQGFVYLIGMVVVEGDTQKQFSFWADTKEQERDIFEQFMAEVSGYEDFRVYCYGSYERAFLKRMRKGAKRKKPVDRVLERVVNVLSVVYSHFYFPCYSNGLKDVAGCLGCSWSEPEASGIQSLVWRAKWEATHDEMWQQRLTTYNLEDCAALRNVADLIGTVGSKPGATDKARPDIEHGPSVAWVEELDRLGTVDRRGKINFFHPDFKYINDCGHFDYQRQRVYVRLGRRRRMKSQKRRNDLFQNKKLRVTQRVEITSRKCPSCGSKDIDRPAKAHFGKGCFTKGKRAFDLVFTLGGVKRKVIECIASVHHCLSCGRVFVPNRYQRLAKHYHGLMSWAMYEHIAHRISGAMVSVMIKEMFGLTVNPGEVTRFGPMMALYYRSCYKNLFDKILSSKLLQVDETEVKLRNGKGYVWVFTTSEEVIYIFRPTREGDFLVDLLKDFRGVLISDFYAAYDAIDCPQQKCLIHLMRDMNQELLNNPFDQDLQAITGPFGVLLREIVTTIDQHGLNCRYLRKYQRRVDQYFQSLATRSCRSEAAEALRGRLVKYRDKLFTFIQHDGVPWNNNNAENAVRQFAYYRDGNPGKLKEPGLKDYLVLLSLYQTCRYRGVSFLKFLLSRKRDLDAFCRRPRRQRRSPLIEVYPKGVNRPDFGLTRMEVAMEETRKLQGAWDVVERITPDGAVTKYNGDGDSSVGKLHHCTLLFRGDTVTTDGDCPDLSNELKWQCRLNPKRRPKTIDFIVLGTLFPLRGWTGPRMPGIYHLEDDSLRLCLPKSGDEGRPTDFEAGKGTTIYTLKRKKL